MSKFIVTFKTVKQAQAVFQKLCPTTKGEIVVSSTKFETTHNIAFPNTFRTDLREAARLAGLNEQDYVIEEMNSYLQTEEPDDWRSDYPGPGPEAS